MFVTNWISTTKIQKISEITNFFRHYFLSRTEVKDMTSEKDIKNVEKKRKRGATGYNEYEIHIDGEVWKLKTEIRKNSRETLYIAFKKK